MNSGAWKDASFKNYNFAAAGQLPEGGALHPLLKMREEMRQIFFDMGYVSLLLFYSSTLLFFALSSTYLNYVTLSSQY
jgi:hypothetical protein